jgi:hypothetical protein
LLKSIDNPRLRLAWTVIIVLAVIILLVQTYHKANRADGNDLTSYLLSATALVNGDNPYDTGTAFPYVYPLFLAFALIPLTILPHGLSVLIWFGLNLAALVYIAVTVAELTSSGDNRAGRYDWLVPTALICVGAFPIIQNNFLNGQVNLIVVALCVLFLRSHLSNRTMAASLFLGAAIAIKLVPVLLIGFLLLRRAFKTAGLSIAFAGLFCLLPVVVVGKSLFTMYADYFSGFVLGNVSGSSGYSNPFFFSLYGFLKYVSAGALDGTGWMIFSVGVVGLVTVLSHKIVVRNNTKAAAVTAFCFYLLAILLVTPMSETHHLAWALPAILVVMGPAIGKRGGVSMSRWLYPAAAVALLYTGTTWLHSPLLFFFIVVLWVGLFRVMNVTTSELIDR